MSSISFDVEMQLSRRLLELLEGEQQVLMSNEIEAMETLLEQKSQIIVQLSQASHKRYQALATAGFEAGEAGMQQWLQQWLQQYGKGEIANAWGEFQEVLTRSKEANRVNGILINKHFNRNQQVLDVLKGPNKAGQFYGPDGQAAVSNSPLRGGITA